MRVRDRKCFAEKSTDKLWENSWCVGRVALIDWLWLKDIALEVCDQVNEGSDAIQFQIAKDRMCLELSEHRPHHRDKIVDYLFYRLLTMGVTLSRYGNRRRTCPPNIFAGHSKSQTLETGSNL